MRSATGALSRVITPGFRPPSRALAAAWPTPVAHANSACRSRGASATAATTLARTFSKTRGTPVITVGRTCCMSRPIVSRDSAKMNVAPLWRYM